MLSALDSRVVDTSGQQYSLNPHSQQLAPSIGVRTGGTGSELAVLPTSPPPLSVTNFETLSDPPSLERASTQAEQARGFPTVSQSTSATSHKSIEDILRDFNLRGGCHPNTDVRIFDDVTTQDYNTLSHIVEEWSLSDRKPKRLNCRVVRLIVEMPTAAHKFSITDFSRVVQPALDRLPINRQRLRVTLEPNLTLRSSLTGFSATPDLALVATPDLALATRPAEGESSSSNLLAVVECAFSQDRNQLMEKVRSEVEGWPGIVLAVVIIVSEACSCHSPLMGSPSWDFFAQHKSCLSPDTFLSLPHSIDECVADTPVKVPSDCLDDSSVSSNVCFDADSDDSDSDTDGGSEPLVLDPIILAGHKWCDIGDVQYYVWVKKDGILDLDGDHAVGVLYPKIAMVDAEVMIKKGLSAVQSEITQLVARTHKPRSILRKLQGVHLSADFNWSEIQAALKFAARLTAVSRYEKWYHENFRGTKRSRSHDTEYKPSRVESSSSAAFLRPQGGTQPRYSLRPRKQ